MQYCKMSAMNSILKTIDSAYHIGQHETYTAKAKLESFVTISCGETQEGHHDVMAISKTGLTRNQFSFGKDTWIDFQTLQQTIFVGLACRKSSFIDCNMLQYDCNMLMRWAVFVTSV